MTLGKFSYLFYLFVFTFIPITILWLKNYRYLIKNLKVIKITALVALIYQAVVDPIAESWKAWFFTKEKTLGIWISNFPIENSLFFLLVSIAISSATLLFIYYQEKGKFKKLLKF